MDTEQTVACRDIRNSCRLAWGGDMRRDDARRQANIGAMYRANSTQTLSFGASV